MAASDSYNYFFSPHRDNIPGAGVVRNGEQKGVHLKLKPLKKCPKSLNLFVTAEETGNLPISANDNGLREGKYNAGIWGVTDGTKLVRYAVSARRDDVFEE